MRYIFFIVGFGLCLAACKQRTNAPAGVGRLKNVTSLPTNPDSVLATALAYVYRPGEEESDLDSAILLAKEVEVAQGKVGDERLLSKIYFVYAIAYREGGDTVLGHHFISLCVPLMEKQGTPVQLGDAYKEKAFYYGIATESDVLAKKALFEKAIKLYREAGNEEKIAYALKFTADLEQILGNYGKSLFLLKESVNAYQHCNCKGLEGAYDLMGAVSVNIGDFTNAVKYGLLAAQTAEQFGDTSLQMATIYNRLAVAYNRWFRYEEGAGYSQRAMNVALKYKDRSSVYVILPNVGVPAILRSQWKEALEIAKNIEVTMPPSSVLDSVYLLSVYSLSLSTGKQYSRAEKYVKQLQDIIKRYKNSGNPDPGLELAYRGVSHYLEEAKKYEDLRQLASDCIAYSKRNKRLAGLRGAYRSLATADTAIGLYREALWAHMNYVHINDSLYNQTKSMQFAQLQVLYETDKKNAEIALKQKDIELLKNQNILQKFRLAKANTLRNVIISAAGLLLVLVSTAYFFQQRHSGQLEHKQVQIDQQNSALKQLLADQQKLLTEKEWLVKEIHHRVKNNLQIIISLFNAQSAYADHPSVVEAIKEGQERMEAIALLHQSLYGPERGSTIAMNSYIPDMVTNLARSAAAGGNVRFQLDIDPIELDISQAVPVGLILNEAITNSLKYAFSPGQRGVITASFKTVAIGKVALTVSDNGIGMPSDLISSDTQSLGMRLIHLFSEQLEGQLAINNEGGTVISLVFKSRKFQTKATALEAAQAL